MTATQFRKQCLRLLDGVPLEGVVITKRGRPVAKLLPIRRSCADLIGSLPDLVVDPRDNLFSTGLRWDAEA